jgi:hypothetical protein
MVDPTAGSRENRRGLVDSTRSAPGPVTAESAKHGDLVRIGSYDCVAGGCV